MIEQKHDNLIFSFSKVNQDAATKLEFQRTLHIDWEQQEQFKEKIIQDG